MVLPLGPRPPVGGPIHDREPSSTGGTLEESLELLRRAVEAGELSATDVLLLRRELVEGRREQIEAAGELWFAQNDLELAVGADLPGGGPQGGNR